MLSKWLIKSANEQDIMLLLKKNVPFIIVLSLITALFFLKLAKRLLSKKKVTSLKLPKPQIRIFKSAGFGLAWSVLVFYGWKRIKGWDDGGFRGNEEGWYW